MGGCDFLGGTMKKPISIALAILMALSATGGLIKMIEQLKKEFDKNANNTFSVQTDVEADEAAGEAYPNNVSSGKDMTSATTSSPVVITTNEKNDTTKPPKTTNAPDPKTEQSTAVPVTTTEIVITTSVPDDDVELPIA
jgi:hypothetical protein